MPKVIVDYDLCQSNAVCMGIMPDVFEVRDDGFLYLLKETVPEEQREKLLMAVRSCPTQAISVSEDEDGDEDEGGEDETDEDTPGEVA